MHDDDRAKYGGPEYLDTKAPVEALNDLDFDALTALDEEVFLATGTGLMRSIGMFATWQLNALRVRLWLALRHAGVDIALADFKPAKILQVGTPIREGAVDADPPASSPESSDISTSATTPESATSASASTRGSRARTSSSRAKSAR